MLVYHKWSVSISLHGMTPPGVAPLAPSLETDLTTTSPLPTGPVCGGPVVHGGLRHPQYFYQDGPGPGARGLAVSWILFFSLYFVIQKQNTLQESICLIT